MLFQIKEIILWPRNSSFSPRRLRFEPGKVNVISGASRTGKSAVIPIIDYCLASSSCNIPVTTIRDTCEWFGVVIKTGAGDKLFARREPGVRKITDEMFVMEAEEIDQIPERIVKNTNADNIRKALDELAGLSNLDFAAGESVSGFDQRPSFRDLCAFVFQPQNVIANPEVMFFKTDQYKHREKLRTIFPYVLGAITPATLAKQHELRNLQLDLRRKDGELKKVAAVSSEWMGEIRSKVSEARELGLLSGSENEILTREQMLAALEEIVNRTDLVLSVSAATINEAVNELNELEGEETKVSRELTLLRKRLSEMTRLRESATSYNEALRIQRDRLKISEWIGNHRAGDENCPVCGGNLEPSEKKLAELQQSLRAIEEQAGKSFQVPAAFDREMERVQNEVNEGTEKLKAIQIRKKSLSRRSNEANSMQYKAKMVERFIGNLENALKLYRQLGEDAELKNEVERLKEKIAQLNTEIQSENIETRKRRALDIVNNNVGRLIPLLDSERPNDPISLKIDDLTITVKSIDREDYLSEIGSGSNWLSYHIAVTLGLQQFFLNLQHSPVPGFVVMDQPSQVYFPRRLAIKENETPDEPQYRDEDIDAVKKAFDVMNRVVSEANGNLQIIVLDHATSDVWGNFANIVSSEEWRNGQKLVPMEWVG